MTLENNYDIKSLTTPAATGGNTVSTTATHRIHTFTSNGTFVANKSMNVEYLIVAGGGGGGSGNNGGGGGAGGLLTNIGGSGLGVTATTYNIVIGNGGPADTNGGISSFNSIVAIGGGRGGIGGATAGSAGGSGGGGSNNTPGGAGTSGQGYAGSSGTQSPPYPAGGGGGSGSVGGSTGGGSPGGNGGIGLQNNITGTNIYYAGGGGGGSYTQTQSFGGLGGGGRGQVSEAGTNIYSSTAGVSNTGGGGGGGSQLASAGGSGIVIISYPLSQDILTPASITATSMTVSPPSESPCREGICTVGVSVTWTNNGESTGSFVPSITASSGTVTPTYSSEQLAPGAPITHSFTVSGMTAGTCTICPNPN